MKTYDWLCRIGLVLSLAVFAWILPSIIRSSENVVVDEPVRTVEVTSTEVQTTVFTIRNRGPDTIQVIGLSVC